MRRYHRKREREWGRRKGGVGNGGHWGQARRGAEAEDEGRDKETIEDEIERKHRNGTRRMRRRGRVHVDGKSIARCPAVSGAEVSMGIESPGPLEIPRCDGFDDFDTDLPYKDDDLLTLTS